jgi:lysozyme
MKLSDKGLKIIMRHEGLRLTAYPDPGSRDGHPWTIGYGHTAGVKKGDKITKAQAVAFLRQDVAWAERAVMRYADGANLTQNQFDALTSFAFNVGVGQFKSSSPARYARQGRHDLVPARLMLWVKNDGRTMKGLVNRRAAEGKLYAAAETIYSRSASAAPVRGKPMSESRTAVTASAQGLGSVAVAVSYGAEIKENVVRMTEGLPVSTPVLLIGGMAVAGMLAAIWFWYDRYNKSMGDGV